MENEKVFAMSSARVYSLLVQKAERKGRTRQEVDCVICWLTGYTQDQLQDQLAKDVPYGNFFLEAPEYQPKSELITGSICGVKIQEISDPLMKKIRQLDKLIDELAKGKPMDKILRGG